MKVNLRISKKAQVMRQMYLSIKCVNSLASVNNFRPMYCQSGQSASAQWYDVTIFTELHGGKHATSLTYRTFTQQLQW